MAVLIKAMLNNDALVVVMDSTDIVTEAISCHKMSMTAAAALGRTLTATAFMSSSLKNSDNKLSVTIDGNGGIGKIVVAANNTSVRGYVENPKFDLPLNSKGKLDVGGAVGTDGYLQVMKDIGMKEPYVGKTELVTGEIGDDFAYYFTVSEQSPSAVALGVQVKADKSGIANEVVRAGGIFVQPLPGCEDGILTMLEDICTNFHNVSGLLQKMTPKEIIDYYFGAFDLKYFDPTTMVYKCACSQEKIDGVVKGLGKKEALDIIKTQGQIEIKCQFCEHEYRYDEEDTLRIFK